MEESPFKQKPLDRPWCKGDELEGNNEESEILSHNSDGKKKKVDDLAIQC